MKRLLSAILVLVLLAALAAPALAAADVRVTTKTVNVYRKKNTDSEVLQKIKKGREVLIETSGSKWCGILVEDYDGQTIGYIQTKYLKCKHSWSKWETDRKATCSKKGAKSRYCKRCGDVETKDIPKLDHKFGKWEIERKATCAKEGLQVRTCKVCGYEQEKTYKEEHTYGAWDVTKEPTCTEKGERERTCEVCGYVQEQTLDMLPHDYEYVVTVETTDHSAGVRAKVCKVCGHTTAEESFDPEGTLRRGSKGEEVRALQQLLVEQGYLNAGGADGVYGGGTEKALIKYQQDRNLNPDGVAWPQTIKDLQHDYGPWETVKEMTRAEAGERVRVCRGCGFEQRETIEPGEVFEHNRRGEDVRDMQQMLTELGFNAGSYDGIYGKKLDTALAGFAEANGLEVEAGKVRPCDMDAVMNAWLATVKPEDWQGEGSTEDHVDLALSITPVGDPDDSGIQTYNWALTNLGSTKVTYMALLLTFGDAPDFMQNNLVMNLDGVDLKPDSANGVSGTFNADADWGNGSLNFAALAVNEANGTKWLSNTVTFENASSSAEKTVAPMDSGIDVNNLPDGIYPVAFDRGDVFSGASGIYMNAVHIYTQDWYDLVDVNTLKPGDTIIVEGEPVPVMTVKNTEFGVLVNDKVDERSFYLMTEEDSNGYYISGLSDLSTYTEQGVTTLNVDPSATFTDAWDIDSEPVTVGYDGIVEALQSSENDAFIPYNTTVRIEAGKVMQIDRAYMP